MFEKLWKWLKVALIAATVATSAAFPSIALAGGWTGTEGNYNWSGGGGPAPRVAWAVASGSGVGDVIWRQGSDFNKFSGYARESLANYIKRVNGKDDNYINSIELIAFTTHSNKWAHLNAIDGGLNYRPFIYDKTKFLWTATGNWGTRFSIVPGELKYNTSETNIGTTAYSPYGTYAVAGVNYPVNNNDNRIISALYIDPDKAWVPTTVDNKKTVIIAKSVNGKYKYNLPGKTNKDCKYLYENGKTKDSYDHTTAANNTNEDYKVTARTAVVHKVETWEYRPSNPSETRNYSVRYYVEHVTNYNKTIKYTTQTPTITQDKYTPFNLNRNGYATSADISSDYANASLKLDGTVDNNQNITNGSALNALDNNSDTKFTFKFNNSVFGLSTLYDWNSQPASLANGTYELVNHSLGYANGKVSSNSDEAYRYNLKLYMSLSTNSKNSSISSSSLLFGNDEITSDSSMVKSATGGSTFTGGDFSSRFTYADTYTTDNGVSGSKFGNWWITTYDEAKLYEYGTHYSGKITVRDGILNPDVVDYGTGSSDGSNYKITINTDNKQRGVYVGKTISSFEQPVLIGIWNVKTLAGDLN